MPGGKGNSPVRHLFVFESKSQPVAPRSVFYRRLGRNGLWAAGFILIGLAIGMAGYMWFESMSAIDAFVNAAMILASMGPMGNLSTSGGKIFAGIYAIFSGLLIFAIAGIVLAPLLHRFLHRFHVQDDTPEKTPARHQNVTPAGQKDIKSKRAPGSRK
ncbi:hypothetical protein [Aestuariivirga sp.]|uniref:hypothetical protein n=1 Tax=Aestuariivirga sp. TaxID=2650926 RepID=UPI0039E612A3